MRSIIRWLLLICRGLKLYRTEYYMVMARSKKGALIALANSVGKAKTLSDALAVFEEECFEEEMDIQNWWRVSWWTTITFHPSEDYEPVQIRFIDIPFIERLELRPSMLCSTEW